MGSDSAQGEAVAATRDVAGLLGAALLDDAGWEHVLQAAARLLPNGRATLLHHDPAASSGALQLAVGIPDAFLAAYRHRLAGVNPWMRHAAGRPLGLVSTTRALLPAAELRRTEFHADFLRPLGLEQGLGLTLGRHGGIDFALSLLGAESLENETRGAMAALQGLAPRLGEAFAVRRRMALAAGTNRFGALRFGPRGAVIAADAAARHALAAGDPFWIDGRGRLHCSAADVEEALLAIATSWGAVPTDTAVRRWLLPRGEGRLPLRVTLTRPGRAAVERYFAGPEAVLILEDPERDLLDLGPVRAFFGLTEAETRALDRLVAGCTVAEIAVLNGTGRETVRSQVKAVLHKMSCRTQAEAVGLAHRLARP